MRKTFYVHSLPQPIGHRTPDCCHVTTANGDGTYSMGIPEPRKSEASKMPQKTLFLCF